MGHWQAFHIVLFSWPNVSYCCWGAALSFWLFTVHTSNTVQLPTFGRSVYFVSLDLPAQ